MKSTLNAIKKLKLISKNFPDSKIFLNISENFCLIENSTYRMLCEDNHKNTSEKASDVKITSNTSEPSQKYNENIKEESEDKIISEGQAMIKNPKHVFYNPVQEFNRDLTVLVATRLSLRKPIHCPAVPKVFVFPNFKVI